MSICDELDCPDRWYRGRKCEEHFGLNVKKAEKRSEKAVLREKIENIPVLEYIDTLDGRIPLILPGENWLPIPGYEGIYDISTSGRIWSNYQNGRMLHPGTNHGYPTTTLKAADGSTRTYRIHRLVLLTFRGPCPEGMESLHWDDNPVNNNLENLRWGTREENLQDMHRNRSSGCRKIHLMGRY